MVYGLLHQHTHSKNGKRFKNRRFQQASACTAEIYRLYSARRYNRQSRCGHWYRIWRSVTGISADIHRLCHYNRNALLYVLDKRRHCACCYRYYPCITDCGFYHSKTLLKEIQGAGDAQRSDYRTCRRIYRKSEGRKGFLPWRIQRRKIRRT